MKKTITKITAIIAILAILGLMVLSATVNADYQDDIYAEADLILQMQRPSGAFALTINSPHIMPYYANLTTQILPALGDEYADATKEYMAWYFDKMNKAPDEIGVIGTIYDYKITEDENGGYLELPEYVLDPTKKIYDSSDSYAATFLSLANEYHRATGDDAFIQAHLRDLWLATKAIQATLDPATGLTNAKADYRVQYMMDNTEVWRGYEDFAELMGRMGYRRASNFYQWRADKFANAIERHLWDEDNEGYRPYVGHDMDWDVYFPDGRANMRAIMFELPAAMNRKEDLFEMFIDNNPEWITNEAGSSPNVATSVTGMKSGDVDTVLEFLENTNDNFEERKWPWKISESGYYIRTLQLLDEL